MSFIAKNPLIAPEVETSLPVPKPGTRALFAGKDGWYDIDSDGNTNKICTGMSNPDWNQNDSTKADYIKNRTHYEFGEGFTLNMEFSTNGENEPAELMNYFTEYLLEPNTEYSYSDSFGNAGKFATPEDLDGMAHTPTVLFTPQYYFNYSNDYESNTVFDALIYSQVGAITGTLSITKEKGVKQLDEKYIPETIARVEQMEKMVQQIMAQLGLVRKTTISLPASAWIEDADGCHQVVEVAGTTAYSMVDLQPTAEQLAIFHEKDVAFVTENEDGVITVYCIGTKPLNDYIIQATVTEVATDED